MQAFFLKNILFNRESPNWRQMSGKLTVGSYQIKVDNVSYRSVAGTVIHFVCFSPSEEEQKTALCTTLSEILESACPSPATEFCLVTWAKGQIPHSSAHTNTPTQPQSQTQDGPEPESSQPPQEQQPSKYFFRIYSH